MIKTKSIIVLFISVLFNTGVIAEERMCFGQVPPDASTKLIAKISISQGNKTFQERKCSHYFKYFDGHLSTSQNQCNAETTGLTLDRGYAPLGVFFRGWESTPKADIKKYYWEIKSVDGTLLATYEAFNAAYVFEEPGQYIATLTVTSTSGAQSVAQHTVDVWERKGNNFYVDSQIGDDRFNGLAKVPETSCDLAKSSVGSCNGPWKTATRAFGEMNPYDVTVMPDGKYTVDAICLDNEIEEIRRYRQGNFKLFRSSANVESEALKDSDGSPLDLIQTNVCVKTVNKRKTVLSPGDQVLFKRNQTFELETGINQMKSYEAKNNGVTYQYERLDTVPLTIVAHWSPAIGVNFSTYGTGEAPVIKNVGDVSAAMIKSQGTGMMNFSMIDLKFDLKSSVANSFNDNRAILLAANADPINLVFKRIDVRNMKQGIIAATKTGNGLFVFDSNFFDSNVIQFFSANSHSNVALVGNSFDYSANHLIYSSIDSGLIYNNELSRPAFGRTAFRLSNGTMTKPNRFVWIAENKMKGWIDPRTSATHGRAFSNGNRYNYTLVDIAPNAPKSNKAVHDIVFTKNDVEDAEIMMSIGNAENLRITDNIFTTADSRGATRIRLNSAFSRRPLKNIRIDNNQFFEKGKINNGVSAATIALANFYQEECGDQKNNEDIQISNNTFSIADNQIRPLVFDTLKRLGNLPNLTLSQAESVLSNTITFTNNTINAASATPVILQVGGDKRALNPKADYDGWSTFYEGLSSTGGKYRLYNQQSNFMKNFMLGTDLKSVFPENDNTSVTESAEIIEAAVPKQELQPTSTTPDLDILSFNTSVDAIDDYIKNEAMEDNTYGETQQVQADSSVYNESENTTTAVVKSSPASLTEVTDKSVTKQKYANIVTLGQYKSSRGSSSTSGGLKNNRSCRAEASDGTCLLP